MKQATFSEGVVVALLAAFLGSMAYTVLPGVIGPDPTFRGLVAGLGLAYVLYLLRRSHEPTGRVVALTVWLLLAGTTGLVIDDPLSYLSVHLCLIWLVRSLYHQPGPVAAVLDLVLNVTALAAGIWAHVHAGSVFLGIWTFFLVQALFVAIPAADGRRRGHGTDRQSPRDPFQLAYNNAESVLRKLSGL